MPLWEGAAFPFSSRLRGGVTSSSGRAVKLTPGSEKRSLALFFFMWLLLAVAVAVISVRGEGAVLLPYPEVCACRRCAAPGRLCSGPRSCSRQAAVAPCSVVQQVVLRASVLCNPTHFSGLGLIFGRCRASSVAGPCGVC